ncbi:MAG: Cobalamin biosynthesis protein CobD [Alphaproteobacteria bacterium MarineAlpha11_Bin1]|nr:MAG: Cobalamin biosynthesis protein CobD [Alphaproteobacteria bacterium MarineAlpha11_Bin1]|tara:strand:+ start:2116 stop:3111 length:996 start_codon:yes stop_codon:yes gene_type:complete
MMFQWYSADAAAVHPLLVVMLALAIDVALGDPPGLWNRVPHPVAVFGSLAAFFDRKMNRPQRSDRVRFWRGLLVTLFLVALAGLVGYGFQWLCAQWEYGWVAGALIASVLIAYRSLFNHVRDVANGLDVSLISGRSAVAHIVGRDPDRLDEHGVARAAIESTAENFSDGVVAPVIWFALLGLPGLFAYKAVNTMDSMIGHRDSTYEHFGKFAARLDDAMNAVPARISGILIVIVAAVGIGSKGGEAWAAAVRDAEKHRSINAGWPEAAMAGALGISLAGPRQYRDFIVDDAWMNEGARTDVSTTDIHRALSLYRKAGAGLMAILLLVMALI